MAEEIAANVVMITASRADWNASLYREEEERVLNAGRRRRLEYTAGRSCARRLLASLGYQFFPLLGDSDKVPIWPEGVKGSISHSNKYCLAIGTDDTSVVSLGVDIEEELDDFIEILPLIATKREEIWIAAGGPCDRNARAILLFSAKESIFKCLFPISRIAFEFHDLEIDIDPRNGTFSVLPCLVSERWPEARSILGRTLHSSPAITLAVLPRQVHDTFDSSFKLSIRVA